MKGALSPPSGPFFFGKIKQKIKMGMSQKCLVQISKIGHNQYIREVDDQ